MQRKGKIARLSHALRVQLNRRLSDNEDGAALLDWLNARPDTQALLARDFGGEPISKQNLYEWRQGGFLEWQTRQEVLDEARELAGDAGDLLDHLVNVLAGRYAAALAGWNGNEDEAFRAKLRLLSRLTRDLVALRRSKHDAARLKMEQERFAHEQERNEPSPKPSRLDPKHPRASFCQDAATIAPSPGGRGENSPKKFAHCTPEPVPIQRSHVADTREHRLPLLGGEGWGEDGLPIPLGQLPVQGRAGFFLTIFRVQEQGIRHFYD